MTNYNDRANWCMRSTTDVLSLTRKNIVVGREDACGPSFHRIVPIDWLIFFYWYLNKYHDKEKGRVYRMVPDFSLFIFVSSICTRAVSQGLMRVTVLTVKSVGAAMFGPWSGNGELCLPRVIACMRVITLPRLASCDAAIVFTTRRVTT